jgi:hypothetical protein
MTQIPPSLPFRSLSVSSPSAADTCWERQAIAVKNTDVTNPYLEAIRSTHDPSLHLKTIEDELKSTIGKALGRQGEKILNAMRQMEQEYQVYQELCIRHGAMKGSLETSTTTPTTHPDCNLNNAQSTEDQPSPPHHPEITASAQRYNEIRKRALLYRWELIVHRQAVGCIVNNHSYVTRQYPIPNALPIMDDSTPLAQTPPSESSSHPTINVNTSKPKQFTDQLDWWQRIGRWR